MRLVILVLLSTKMVFHLIQIIFAKANIPENVTQVKSFSGMLNYYHRHSSNLADTLEPLHKLLRKKN